ncbi:hypothetical protein B7494_g5081 [Chlorociboria aeruginascens]|nr:hypothetical protein B7494_g5081 [Chlorociboria aeruginascens]
MSSPSMAGSDSSIHALVLPLVRAQPSFETLLDLLNRLEIGPSSWNSAPIEVVEFKIDTTTSRWLLSVISSDLSWMIDSEKHKLWELAAKRIAERCGRSALPGITRQWAIPQNGLPEIIIILREPALTGDNLGLKTWGTAYTMAKKLDEIADTYLSHLIPGTINDQDDLDYNRVLELGSGTGLLGIAAALIWGVPVVLTDLPEILPNLKFNVDENKLMAKDKGLCFMVQSCVLDWSAEDTSKVFKAVNSEKFEIIIASDPFYDTKHPQMLTRVIAKHLSSPKYEDARVFISVPLRDAATIAMKDQFLELMQQSSFVLHAAGKEVCYDDWTTSNEVPECWWGIFGPVLNRQG